MAKNKTKKKAPAQTNRMGLTKAETGRIVTVRLLIAVLFDLVLATLFDYVVHSGEMELTFHNSVQMPLVYASVALFVLSLAYVVFARVKKINTARHALPPEQIAALTFLLAVTLVFYDKFRIHPPTFFVLMIVETLLLAVYYIYTMLLY